MIRKSKQPEPLPIEDTSCSLLLCEAFLQHGLEEKNVKTESPATKRKITLNIQNQLWIILFFLLQATNDLLKKKKERTDVGNISKRIFLASSHHDLQCQAQLKLTVLHYQ